MEKPDATKLRTPEQIEEYLSKWGVRRYRPGDEVGLNELFKRTFGENRSLDCWRWKFDDAPWLKEKAITVKEADGKIIGQWANAPVRFKVGDDFCIFHHPVDNCVDPEHWGKGIIKGLYNGMFARMRELGVAIGLGFPNETYYQVGKAALGFEDLLSLPIFVRRTNFRLAVEKRTSLNFLSIIASRFSTIVWRLRLFLKRPSATRNVRVQEVEELDEEFDLLWQSVAPSLSVCGVRDREYLEWRYRRNPFARFHILKCSDEQMMLGYAVLALERAPEGHRIGYIMDLFCHESERIIDCLVNASLRYLIDLKADYVKCGMLEHCPHHGVLKKYGFSFRGEHRPLVFQEIDPDFHSDLFLGPGNWFLTLGDTDFLG